jgi:hypothetical protein
MDTFIPLVAAVALIYGATNMLKVALAGQGKVVVTQLVSWVIAVAVVFLLQASDFASAIAVGEAWSLDTLNVWSTILVGVSFAGAGNVVYDIIPKDTPTIGSVSPYEG